MKWLGQYIQSFTARFRDRVYIENIGSSTETDMVVVDSDGLLSKRAIDAITVDVSDFMTNGADNRVLTATGTDAMNAEANLTFDGSSLSLTGNGAIIKNTATSGTTSGGLLRLRSDDGAALGDDHRLGSILFQAAEDSSDNIDRKSVV